jgi:RNA polymerase sigma-70 factor (ECF subfamily)
MSTHDDLDALVTRAAAGDPDALHGIYVELAPRLHRFVLVRVRERADADDLVQRVFLKMIEALPRYEQRGIPFAAWAFRLARNSVIDFERTRRSHEPLDALTERPADAAGPPELAELEAERTAVRSALATLTPDQQDVIAYRFFAGLTPAEIGALMGRREGSIRALQFRALKALRTRLDRSLADRFPGSAPDPLGADPTCLERSDPAPDEPSPA